MPRLAPRAGLGVVYTPRDVCEPMVRRALEPLLATRTPDELRELRVCDPAIGEGAFLIEVVRVLAEAIGGPHARREVAAHCLHGVDRDVRAVAAARRAIEDFVGAPVPALCEHLRVADALTCTWDRFDVVIGNPPYIRQEQLADKRALRRFAVYHGVADLYVYFVELAHRIGQRYCLVVPTKWMTARYGAPLRSLLATSLEGLVDFTDARPLFADADAFPCIVWGGRERTGPPRARRARAGSVARALAAPGTRQTWSSDAPWSIETPPEAALLSRLSRWPTLGDAIGARWSRGVVTGCNRAFVIDAAERAALIAAEPAAAALIRPFVKGRDVRRWTAARTERYVLMIDHGTSLAGLPALRTHLARFRVDLEPRRPGARGPGRKPGRYHWFELQDPVVPLARERAPRLLYQDIQTQPACCFDPSGELVPDTTVWILPSSDLFVLAVLNSPLYFWYARRRFPPALNGAVRPKLAYMRALPLATPPAALRARIAELAAAQLVRPTAARDAELARLVADAYLLSASDRELVASAARNAAGRDLV
jgi:hypothetical protein